MTAGEVYLIHATSGTRRATAAEVEEVLRDNPPRFQIEMKGSPMTAFGPLRGNDNIGQDGKPYFAGGEIVTIHDACAGEYQARVELYDGGKKFRTVRIPNPKGDPMTPEIQWIKTPLEDSLNWQDFPAKTEGRVILKKWPAETKTAGGLEIPGQENRRIIGVAWVYRASGDAGKILCPGDSVLVPQYAVESGLQFPSGGAKDLDDFREVDAECIYHVLPYAKAQEWRFGTSQALAAECSEALPKIRLMADEGDCPQALAWLSKLRAKAETCSEGMVENLKAEEADVLQKAQAHAERKAREAQEEEIAAKDRLAAERKRIADERNK